MTENRPPYAANAPLGLDQRPRSKFDAAVVTLQQSLKDALINRDYLAQSTLPEFAKSLERPALSYLFRVRYEMQGTRYVTTGFLG